MDRNVDIYMESSKIYWIVFYVITITTFALIPLNFFFNISSYYNFSASILLSIVLFSLLIFFIYFTIKRHFFLKNVSFITDYGHFIGNNFQKRPIAVKVLPEVKGLVHLNKFLKDLYNNRTLLLDLEEKLSKAGFKLSKKAFSPIITITIEQKHSIFMIIGGKRFKVVSLFDKNGIRVEWLNDKITYSLIEHELAHLLVYRTDPSITIEKHHKLFKKAGIL